jgi:hypothetical protein
MSINLLGLRIGSIETVPCYVSTQINNLFSDKGLDNDIGLLAVVIPKALDRMRPILESVRNFTDDFFDHFHSLQYAIRHYGLQEI